VCRSCRQPFCWLCGAKTGTAHTWERIDGHTCGEWKVTADKVREESKARHERYMHYYGHYTVRLALIARGQTCRNIRHGAELDAPVTTRSESPFSNGYCPGAAVGCFYRSDACSSQVPHPFQSTPLSTLLLFVCPLVLAFKPVLGHWIVHSVLLPANAWRRAGHILAQVSCPSCRAIWRAWPKKARRAH
jgi:hypothetical protein